VKEENTLIKKGISTEMSIATRAGRVNPVKTIALESCFRFNGVMLYT
jgi:hypothetical protein